MKITNKLGLPQALVNAVKNDGYSPGPCNITVSKLVSPPKIVALTNIHYAEIEEDVSDRLWSLFGQAVHHILAQAETEAVTEQRLTIQRQEWVISGAFDRFAVIGGILQDYKVTNVYAASNGIRAEWIAQLNLYATILREHGQEVKQLEVVAIMRDWSKSAQQRHNNYPSAGVMKIEVPLWSEEQCESYLDERIRLHQIARKVLPECTPEERWQTQDVFAVMKLGGKRAVRLFDCEADAHAFAETSGAGLSVQKRSGTSIRCESYCQVSQFCEQWKNIPEPGENDPFIKI